MTTATPENAWPVELQALMIDLRKTIRRTPNVPPSGLVFAFAQMTIEVCEAASNAAEWKAWINGEITCTMIEQPTETRTTDRR